MRRADGGNEIAPETIDWLLDGDPAIRWQVLRDLLGAEHSAERRRVARQGWGRQLIDLQFDDGRWTAGRGPKGYRGLYIPKWTSTTYTLLLLRRLGLPSQNAAGHAGCTALVHGSQWFEDGSVGPWSARKTDTCVCGMFLGLLEYFDHAASTRREALLGFLLEEQKNDGGWNCRADSNVSSVHTTISVLEGLALVDRNKHSQRSPTVEAAIRRGQEYLLKRRLFRSLRSGQVIQPNFKKFSFPPRWKYDVLRALENFVETGARADPRLEEAIQLVIDKRRKDGTWTLQNRHSGETHFEFERPGQPSRWNTLRALRVLKWWSNL